MVTAVWFPQALSLANKRTEFFPKPGLMSLDAAFRSCYGFFK